MDGISKYTAIVRQLDLSTLGVLEEAEYAQSTRSKDRKVYGALTEICRHLEVEPFRLTRKWAIAIIQVLQACDVARSTVFKVIIPSYKRLYQKWMEGAMPCEEIILAFKQAAKRIPVRVRDGKNAFLLCDLFRLIRLYTVQFGENPRLFSLLAFALFTGTRISDTAALTLGEIRSVLRSGRGYFVSIQCRRVKGGKPGPTLTLMGEVQEQRICGDMLQVTDPVFWLNRHLLRNLGFPLDQLQNMLETQPDMKRRKLWQWGSAWIAKNFKQATEQVGYPPHFFSFHSLRKGMISTRLLMDAGRHTRQVMDIASIIGNWTLPSKSRDAYLTGSLGRTFVANGFGTNVIAPELLSVNGYHRLNFLDAEASKSMDPDGVVLFPVQDRVVESVLDECAELDALLDA